MIIKYYKIIDISTSYVVAVSQTGDYIPKVRYVAENNSVVLCNPKNIKQAFGVSINGDTYSTGKQFKDFPVCEFIEITREEYLYLKNILDKAEEAKRIEYENSLNAEEGEEKLPPEAPVQIEDTYDNYQKSNDSDIMKFTREMKIREMRSKCKEKIVSGIDVSFTNDNTVIEHFELTIEDQVNLNGLRAMVYSNNGVNNTLIPYHCKGGEFKYYSREDILKIIECMDKHILYHTSYFNSLKMYINNLTDYNVVNSVEYGQEIPFEYMSEVFKSFFLEEDAI